MVQVRSGLVAAFVIGLVGCAATPKPALPNNTSFEAQKKP